MTVVASVDNSWDSELLEKIISSKVTGCDSLVENLVIEMEYVGVRLSRVSFALDVALERSFVAEDVVPKAE